MTRLCTCTGSFESTFELKKRNQLAEPSCNTCGGRFLVDGMGSISENMLSTVGLEAANSINPELSWKAVRKGRRSRKAVARSLNGSLKVIRSPKRVGDFSTSDSEKIGEARHQFSDKVENVPIKKRRHLRKAHNPSSDGEESLSPKSLPTPMHSEQISAHNHSSGDWSSNSYSSGTVSGCDKKTQFKSILNVRVMDAKISEVANGKFYDSEDFSGIALLAAAACINNDMDDDADNGKEAHAVIASATAGGSAGSSSSPKEISALTESVDPIRGDIMHASNAESYTVGNGSAVVLAPKGLAKCESSGSGAKSVSSKVDRSHWDLNTLMDAWEQPQDSVLGNAFEEGLKDGAQMEKLETEILYEKKDTQDYQHDPGKCMPPLPDQNEAISSAANVKAEVLKPESVSIHDRICGEEMSVGNLGWHCTEALDSLSEERKTYGELDNGDTSLPDSSFSKSYNALGMLVSDGFITMASDGGLIKTQAEDSAAEDNGFIKAASSKVPFQKPDYASALKCKDNNEPITTILVPDDSDLNATGAESSESNPTEADFSNSTSKCEDLSASRTCLTEGQSVTTEPKEQHGSILADDSRMQLGVKEVNSKFNDCYASNQVEECMNFEESSKSCNEGLHIDDPASQFAKIALALEDSHNSDISQEGRGQMIGGDDRTGLEAGYDSPFEDGELRGSISYTWGDNEIEDGETECVDYESDGGGGVDSDAADHPASEIVEAGSDGSQGIDKRISSASARPKVDFDKGRSSRDSPKRQFSRDDNDNIDSGGRKGLDKGSGSAAQQSGGFRKGHASYHMGGYEFRESYIEENGMKTNRDKLQSRIEGPPYLDAADGKDAEFMHQSRPRILGSYHRPERELSPDKFIGRYRSGFSLRDRGAGDGQWNCWKSRNRYPSIYHGPEGQSYTRRRSYADSAGKFGGLDSRDQRQSINHPSKGVHRPFVRRRSSVERDDYYDVHRRMISVRGGYRSRGGAGNFSHRFGRGIREEGYEPVPDDGDGSSVRLPQYLPREERSFSPASGRGAHISVPRRKSRSRSRTRSPHPWHTQRERNFSTRRHSRSPDLRPDARMERPRMPFRKPGFTAEYGDEDFSSPPRGHCLPERRSRWVDERSFAGDHLRRKGPPMDVTKRSQRFDSVGGSSRLKSDDYYRPMMRPGPMAGSRGGGYKFEGNYHEKRRNDRFEPPMHRNKHSDVGVGFKRFEPDTADGIEAAGNSHTEEDIGSTDQKELPVNAREEKKSSPLTHKE